ncbi:MAG TPA: undecaprenyl-diphosphate phosphatase [Solirubrobacteraceae bacterium]|jgi:undecaprenyl-diphosphatase
MPPADSSPGLAQALALGLLQGPAELLPISSSAHTTLLGWLAGLSYRELPAEARKDFEVALHAGTGLALALRMGGELWGERAVVLAPAVGVPALVGLVFEGPIERRLGGPRSISVGLVAGAVAMAVADRRGETAGRDRGAAADARDGLALGLAQAAALAPGLSRNGATLAVARWRGFSRARSQTLSWRVGLPVILGPVLLRARGIRRRGAGSDLGAALAVGAGGAFVSGWAAAGLLRRPRFREAPLWRYALYRCALAAFVAVRLRRSK